MKGFDFFKNKISTTKKGIFFRSLIFLTLFLSFYGENIFSNMHFIKHKSAAYLNLENNQHNPLNQNSDDKNCALCTFVNFQNQIVFYPQLFFALSLICLAYVLKQKSKISISNLFFKSFARAPPVSF